MIISAGRFARLVCTQNEFIDLAQQSYEPLSPLKILVCRKHYGTPFSVKLVARLLENLGC